MKKIIKKLLALPLILSLCLTLTAAFYALIIPDTVSCFSGSQAPAYLGALLGEVSESEDGGGGTPVSVCRGSYKLLGVIPVKSVRLNKLEDVRVYVGGIPFGLKFSTKGAVVVGFDDESTSPAYLAGLRADDVIVAVNGKKISGISDITEALRSGETLSVSFLRGGRENSVKIKPRLSESERGYTMGVYLKDSGAGIGTLTYVLADGRYGGLGHGVCDGESGELVEMDNGRVLGVTLNGVTRGERGAPGELRGYFNSSPIGTITQNTECGVFGRLDGVPEEIADKQYKIGLRGEVREGEATIICTTESGARAEYKIEISDIDRGANGNKCFGIKVTDKRLLADTGGIVRGMSGSPIIQNGKLVGAVTHVLVNDPTSGYGIFIENMLTQMRDTENSASAREAA